MTILANLQNINLSFGDKVLFDQTSFTVKESDRIGLIGLNGKGKSTLLKIIKKEVQPDTSNPPFIYDQKKDLTLIYIPQELDQHANFNKAAHYYLNFYPELAILHGQLSKIEEQLTNDYSDSLIEKQSEVLEQIEQLSGWEIEQNYHNYLKKFEIPQDKDIKLLSGGQRRKVALSIGLSSKHQLVLWDEPTNHLDIESIEKFEDELKMKKNTFIMISHDRYILSSICDNIVHILRGKIEKFHGNYLDYITLQEELEKERSQKLDKLKNSHRRELAWMRQGIKARGTRSKKRVEGFHSIESDIQRLKDQKKKELNLQLAHSSRKTKVLIKVKNLGFSYGDELILKDTNLTLHKSDRIALIGKNGAGKSTFLNILMGKLEYSNDQVKKADGLKINYFSQNRSALIEEKTPFEIIGDGQEMIHLPNGGTIHINSYLDKFLFSSSEIRRPISTLSGGEKNRLQLALFMKSSADIWIFDEPTNDLDIETIETLESTLIEYNQAVIIVSHDRAFLDKVTTKSWILKDKSIEEYSGNYSDNADLLIEFDDKKKARGSFAQKEKKEEQLSNKQKQRLQKIDSEIEDAETKLEQINKKIANLDYTQDSKSLRDEVQKLEEQKFDAQKKVDILFKEWEELNNEA